jgi:hypothetical protein
MGEYDDVEKDTAQSYVLEPTGEGSGPAYDIDDPTHDAVFGEKKEGHTNYRSVGW